VLCIAILVPGAIALSALTAIYQIDYLNDVHVDSISIHYKIAAGWLVAAIGMIAQLLMMIICVLYFTSVFTQHFHMFGVLVSC